MSTPKEKELPPGVIRLLVAYIDPGYHGPPREFDVCSRSSDTVESFINHLEYSLDFDCGRKNDRKRAPHCVSKKLFKDNSKYRGLQNQIKPGLGEKVTLKSAGVRPNQKLYLQGYSRVPNCCYSIPVQWQTAGKETKTLTIKVTNNTTIRGLKHKIQDCVGIPAAEQVLCSDKNQAKPLSDENIAVQVVVVQKQSKYLILKSRQEIRECTDLGRRDCHTELNKKDAESCGPLQGQSNLFPYSDHQSPQYIIIDPSAEPSLNQLAKLSTPCGSVEIIREVAHIWKQMGCLFDFDRSGNMLKIIEHNHKNLEDCCVAMFQHWLDGNGQGCTWENLVKILKDCRKIKLAEKVRSCF